MADTLKAQAETNEAARKLRNREKSLIFEHGDSEKSYDEDTEMADNAVSGTFGDKKGQKDDENEQIDGQGQGNDE